MKSGQGLEVLQHPRSASLCLSLPILVLGRLQLPRVQRGQRLRRGGTRSWSCTVTASLVGRGRLY